MVYRKSLIVLTPIVGTSVSWQDIEFPDSLVPIALTDKVIVRREKNYNALSAISSIDKG